MTDLRTLSPKWDVSIKSFSQWSEKPMEKEEQSLRARENQGHPEKNGGPLHQHYENSYEITESMHMACTGVHQVFCMC